MFTNVKIDLPEMSDVIESFDDLVLLISDEGHYLAIWTKEPQRLFRPPADLLGKTVHEVLIPEHADMYMSRIKECLKKDEPLIFEYTGRPYNELHFRARLTPLAPRPGERRRLSMVIQDITESKRLEKDLVVARAAQMNSSKLAALGEMAGGISHEINNPLAIIQAKTHQILKRVQNNEIDREKIMTDLGKITDTCVRISKIVRGLKSFARNADQDPFQVLPLVTVLDDVLSLSRERFYNNQIDLRLQASLQVSCQCRPTQIAQVVLNLLNNAFDAVVGKPSPWVHIEITESEKFAEIRVTDSGPGIAPEIRHKIMDPFFTTKEVGKGTGLGLSISRGIIEQHAGQIVLDEKNPNTSFIIRLPKKPENNSVSA